MKEKEEEKEEEDEEQESSMNTITSCETHDAITIVRLGLTSI